MAWDPVKPFKCKCLKGYFGELCENSKYSYMLYAQAIFNQLVIARPLRVSLNSVCQNPCC